MAQHGRRATNPVAFRRVTGGPQIEVRQVVVPRTVVFRTVIRWAVAGQVPEEVSDGQPVSCGGRGHRRIVGRIAAIHLARAIRVATAVLAARRVAARRARREVDASPFQPGLPEGDPVLRQVRPSVEDSAATQNQSFRSGVPRVCANGKRPCVRSGRRNSGSTMVRCDKRRRAPHHGRVGVVRRSTSGGPVHRAPHRTCALRAVRLHRSGGVRTMRVARLPTAKVWRACRFGVTMSTVRSGHGAPLDSEITSSWRNRRFAGNAIPRLVA